MRCSTSSPGSSSPRALAQLDGTPSRASPIATLLSAPPIDSVTPLACRNRPGDDGTTSTIVSPAVTTRGTPAGARSPGSLTTEERAQLLVVGEHAQDTEEQEGPHERGHPARAGADLLRQR